MGLIENRQQIDDHFVGQLVPWGEVIDKTPYDMAGLLLPTDTDMAHVVAWFSHVQILAIDFTAAFDGRGFSQAWMLRNRYGWRGLLRAEGGLIADQLAYAEQMGFDQIRLKPHNIDSIEKLTSAWQAPVWRYQPDAAPEMSILEARRRARNMAKHAAA